MDSVGENGEHDTLSIYTAQAIMEVNIIFGLLLLHIGFALIEAARSREKNVATVLTKHATCTLISILAFWICGYGLALGDGHFFAGTSYFVLHSLPSDRYAHFMIHSLISGLPISIVSGAIAERSHFTGQLVLSVLSSGLIYPISLHWFINTQGWMYQYGTVDIGLVAQVHVFSGTLALLSCAFIGRRIEKLTMNNSDNLPGHSLPLAFIGSSFIIIGLVSKVIGLEMSNREEIGKALLNLGDHWEKVSGLTRKSIGLEVRSRDEIGAALVNIGLAAASGGLISAILYKIGIVKQNDYELRNSNQNRTLLLQSRKWSFFAVMNGSIAGLVGVSGGSSLFAGWVSLVIGLVSGALYFITSQLIKLTRVDDCTDAISIHLIPGLWGAIVVPLLTPQVNSRSVQVGWTIVGCLAIMCWCVATFSIILLFLFLIKKLRVSTKIEIIGADAFKVSEQAYSNYDDQNDAHDHDEGRETFMRFASPAMNVPVIFGDQKEQRRPLGKSTAKSASCTAVVTPLGPTMSSTHKNLAFELQHLSKSVPKIIVEEDFGMIELQPPPPPPPPYRPSSAFSLTQVPDIDVSIIPPPLPPAPPSSPDMNTGGLTKDMKLDVESLRLTLKQQKKRLKETGVRTDTLLNSSQTSLSNSRTSVNSAIINDIRSNENNFNYLSPATAINLKPSGLGSKILESWTRRRSFDTNDVEDFNKNNDDVFKDESKDNTDQGENVTVDASEVTEGDDLSAQQTSEMEGSHQNDTDSFEENEENSENMGDPNNNNNFFQNDLSSVQVKDLKHQLSTHSIETVI